MKVRTIGALAVAVLAGLGAPAQAAGNRPTVAVMDFDYGTVNNWWGREDIGKGMADQVVDAILEDGSFRVIERKKLDTVMAEQDFAQSDRADPSAAKLSKLGKILGVKYILAGSITKFGTEEKNFGTGGLMGGKIGGLGIKKAKTQVALTVRMIDTTTGEILLSAKGLGESKKGGGATVAAGSWGRGAGAFHMGSPEYKDSAIGEAQEMATTELVKAIVAKKDRLE